jgi:toxin-antitoxin system PIN domain toxin
MILPDVNVLIYAFRADAQKHELCSGWLTRIVRDDPVFGMSPLALSSLVRITTNFSAFEEPSTAEEAFRFCDFLLQQPHCQIVEPRDGHWQIFQRLVVDSQIRGKRVSDAWFAALAIEWGCEWISFDRDFARFPGLKWSGPTL